MRISTLVSGDHRCTLLVESRAIRLIATYGRLLVSNSSPLPRYTDLAKRSLLPHEHLVDSGYMSAEHIVVSQREHDVQLLGPVLPDPSWQAKTAGAFGTAAFTID